MTIRVGKYRAFTLIELLAVAAVIAMAAVGTTTLLMRGNQKTAVMRYGQELALAARAARIHAVQNSQTCRLVLEQGNRRFYVVGPAEETLVPGEEAVISTPLSRPVQMPETITFEKIGILGEGEEQTEIVFRPNGSAQTAILQIGDGKYHATVTILEATGRIKMTPGELTTLLVDQVDLDEIEPAY